MTRAVSRDRTSSVLVLVVCELVMPRIQIGTVSRVTVQFWETKKPVSNSSREP